MTFAHETALREECGYKGYQPWVLIHLCVSIRKHAHKGFGLITPYSLSSNTSPQHELLVFGMNKRMQGGFPHPMFLTPSMVLVAMGPTRKGGVSQTAHSQTIQVRLDPAMNLQLSALTENSTTTSAHSRPGIRWITVSLDLTGFRHGSASKGTLMLEATMVLGARWVSPPRFGRSCARWI